MGPSFIRTPPQVSKSQSMDKKNQGGLHGSRYSPTDHQRGHGRPDCLQYHRPKRSKGDVGQTQKYLY